MLNIEQIHINYLHVVGKKKIVICHAHNYTM